MYLFFCENSAFQFDNAKALSVSLSVTELRLLVPPPPHTRRVTSDDEFRMLVNQYDAEAGAQSTFICKIIRNNTQ